MNVNDDGLLIKYKQLGLADKVIAEKLGISVGELQRRWDGMVERASKMVATGYDSLSAQYNTLCQQYQLLGESLKVIAMALANVAPPSEVRAHIKDHPEETLNNLITSFIILRPFVPADPSQSLQEHLKRSQEGN